MGIPSELFLDVLYAAVKRMFQNSIPLFSNYRVSDEWHDVAQRCATVPPCRALDAEVGGIRGVTVGTRHALRAHMSFQTEMLLMLPNDEARIVAAIQEGEDRTTAEFHVCVEATSRDPFGRAGVLLAAATARGGRRQRILFLLLTHERRCIVVTDPALRVLTTTRVWRDVENKLTLDVLHGRLAEGTADAIHRLSFIAAGHFPSGVGHSARG